MVQRIQKLVRGADKAMAHLYLTFRSERSSVLCFLFHSLFKNGEEIAQNLVDPLQRTTVAAFRQFIEYFQGQGYQFVSVADLLHGLDPTGKYVVVTFDDGYFNNALARPILEEFSVPAAFFISTDHVRQNKSFWWDVLFRERMAEGASTAEIYREGVALKTLRTHHIEEILKHRFGNDAFTPRGDIDRPFSPEDLSEFSQSPLVTLGNHTADHAILTNYSAQQIREQIEGAQQWLEKLADKAVISIAYPNGAFSKQIVEASAALGLRVGFTVQPTKNHLPMRNESILQLGRFAMHDGDTIESQCLTCRSDLLIYSSFREAYLRLAGRRVMR